MTVGHLFQDYQPHDVLAKQRIHLCMRLLTFRAILMLSHILAPQVASGHRKGEHPALFTEGSDGLLGDEGSCNDV